MGRGRQGLAQHLAAEDIAEAKILAVSPEDVFLDFFKLEKGQQFI